MLREDLVRGEVAKRLQEAEDKRKEQEFRANERRKSEERIRDQMTQELEVSQRLKRLQEREVEGERQSAKNLAKRALEDERARERLIREQEERIRTEVDSLWQQSFDREAGIFNLTNACALLLAECQSVLVLAKDDWIGRRLADFNLWAAGIRASTTGHASLDYRVRDRSDVKHVILGILRTIKHSAERCLGESSLSFTYHQTGGIE